MELLNVVELVGRNSGGNLSNVTNFCGWGEGEGRRRGGGGGGLLGV